MSRVAFKRMGAIAKAPADAAAGEVASMARELMRRRRADLAPTPTKADLASSRRMHAKACAERDALAAEVSKWRENQWNKPLSAPPLPIHGCACHACEVLRRQQAEFFARVSPPAT